MNYSKYQDAIFDFVRQGNGHGEIIAPAGSGKTFTGVQSVKFIPKGMTTPNVVYLAFNKHIQVELQQKLPDWAIAKTYHSFGLSAMQGNRFKISEYKNHDILQAHFGRDLSFIFPVISRITGLFKGNLISDVSHQVVNDCVDQYGIEIGEEGESYFDEIVEGVSLCLDPSHVERLGKIDFDDMIWYPLVRNLPIPKVDYLLVDEYQDSNASQMELTIRAKNSHGRVIAIGDPKQAIYGWRGAGTNGMEVFAERLNATILPLSITYRCPRAVVQFINEQFPDIPFEVWDQAIEGSVNTVTEEQMFKNVLPGDMVLCRLNAPLVAPAMRLLREGKKAIIKGKDIGKNLITMIHQIEKKFYPETIQEFLADMDEWVAKESLKLRTTQRHSQADLLEDKAETLMAFAMGVDSVNEMKENITRIFADDVEGVCFSSGHRAKGLQTDNTYILHPELFPFKRAKTPEAKAQELNLRYVACTRSKVSLNFVQG
jgi:DNA helicase-2/ATP-dependent DNA helicase PcrA